MGTRQLETETGITRFSLQTTVGGKEKLFLAALGQYLDISEQLIAPRMTDGSLDTIAHWFEARPRGEGLPAVSCNGCMMIAAMAEFQGDSAAGTAIANSTATMVRAWQKN